ncbi:MAG: YceI family protein [Candidatus Cyclonatronum sp.]|uniref:YceI family protein n=1 Tax=Cyclonatronum sp. TaxID=3024185 RepID=UPI0025B84C3E|nr:YceI family protein [Cyclonatronum sp.]MCH8486961.1 YceI family protein [Cyclonatronum sp.]
MKPLFLSLIALLLPFTLFAQPDTPGNSASAYAAYSVNNALSSMTIAGGSTVGSWDADVTLINARFSVNLEALQNGGSNAFQLGEFVIPVERIESDGNRMTNNIHKYLEKDRHPNITFTFVSAELQQTTDAGTEVLVNGIINAAGADHAVSFVSNAAFADDQSIVLSGTVDFGFSDFNISRPSAMLGTVRASEELQIIYELVLTSN